MDCIACVSGKRHPWHSTEPATSIVPQRNRRDRIISDYSFFRVNEETVPLAPHMAMQFGQTLKRLLQRIHRANDVFGPVYMPKIDLLDGFYCLWLQLEDRLKLAVLFPPRPGKEHHWPIPWAGVCCHQISVRAWRLWQILPTPTWKIHPSKLSIGGLLIA